MLFLVTLCLYLVTLKVVPCKRPYTWSSAGKIIWPCFILSIFTKYKQSHSVHCSFQKFKMKINRRSILDALIVLITRKKNKLNPKSIECTKIIGHIYGKQQCKFWWNRRGKLIDINNFRLINYFLWIKFFKIFNTKVMWLKLSKSVEKYAFQSQKPHFSTFYYIRF